MGLVFLAVAVRDFFDTRLRAAAGLIFAFVVFFFVIFFLAMNGGCLENEFRLIQFHAHWGTTAGAKGSEHTVNGKLYDAELHLVHWNTKYGTFTKAVSEPDGLAVIGIFMQLGEEDHPEFEKVVNIFDKIHYKNMKAAYDEDIDPTKFLPSKLRKAESFRS